MFLFSIFFLAMPSVFGQPATNALPNLLPAYGEMPPTFWERHGIAVLAGGLILIALAAALVWKILKPGPQRILPPAIIAREALARCRGRSEDGRVLSEVSQALRHYAVAALGFPPAEFTTAEFCRELERSEKITPELTHVLSDFLRECDERKFAPAVSPAPLNAADRALEFIALIEEETQGQENVSAIKNERRV